MIISSDFIEEINRQPEQAKAQQTGQQQYDGDYHN
jgi:hypothetical protein